MNIVEMENKILKSFGGMTITKQDYSENYEFKMIEIDDDNWIEIRRYKNNFSITANDIIFFDIENAIKVIKICQEDYKQYKIQQEELK